MRRTDPGDPTAGVRTQGSSGPGTERPPDDPSAAERAPADPAPDAGRLEPVAGTGTGLRREVGRMADGRRITYYWSRPGAPS